MKRYLDEQEGRPIDTVWTDIPPLNSRARERLGYPTQKPLALLDRIVKASSNQGDIVLDAFCGCGTALEAAQKLGRQWIGIDISPTSCHVMAKRLRDKCGLKQDEDLWKIGRGFIVRRFANDACGLVSRCGHYRPPHFQISRCTWAKETRKETGRTGARSKTYH